MNQKRERGMQLVELAIVLPVVMALMAAIAEFGNYFYTYTTLAKATRAGARYLSSKSFTGGEKDKARRIVVCGNPDSCASGTEILPGLTTGHIQVTSSGGTTYLPQTIRVSIAGYNYNSVFNLAGFGDGSSWLSVAVEPGTTMRYTLEN
ncbi:MAG: TadE/TadG family type IV pilus assembly protein [Blastocatellia bacterium]